MKELISTARMLDKTTNEIISKQDVVNERKSFRSISKMTGRKWPILSRSVRRGHNLCHIRLIHIIDLIETGYFRPVTFEVEKKTLKSIKDYYQQQISKKSSEIYARVNVALEKMEQVYREEIGGVH